MIFDKKYDFQCNISTFWHLPTTIIFFYVYYFLCKKPFSNYVTLARKLNSLYYHTRKDEQKHQVGSNWQ